MKYKIKVSLSLEVFKSLEGIFMEIIEFQYLFQSEIIYIIDS